MENTRILVVDDDPLVREATVRMLRSAGHETLEAADGRAAVAAAVAHRPEMVILDVVMPGMGGHEACRRIKSDPRLEGTFVVLASGTSVRPDEQAHGQTLGADGYVTRPLHRAEFLARVDAFLRIRHAEIRVRDLNRDLEQRVEARTRELEDAVQLLEEKNIALRELLGQIEREKERLARDVTANVERVVMPLLERLRPRVPRDLSPYLALLEEHLQGVVSSLGRSLGDPGWNLSPREVEICALVRAGRSTKEIADHLSLSAHTVQTQRRTIRRKLGLDGRTRSLRAFLQTLGHDGPR
jgi:DNA-binding NarL/FixJ family response regulator